MDSGKLYNIKMPDKKNLEKLFDSAINEWIDYLENSHVLAMPNHYSKINCNAYVKIREMSYSALPLIRKLYDKNGNDFSSDIKNHCSIGKYHLISGKSTKQLFQTVEKIKRREFVLSCIKGYVINLVEEIMKDEFQIPEKIMGDIQAMEHYTKEWLDDNLEYVI